MISDLRKEKYFCAEDWTAQTGIEFPQEIRFLARGIFELSCLAIGARSEKSHADLLVSGKSICPPRERHAVCWANGLMATHSRSASSWRGNRRHSLRA
jgi:hypothetical protein